MSTIINHEPIGWSACVETRKGEFIFFIFAFDEGERTLIEIFSRFYGLYDVVNLAPPENFSGANDVISMPCASVLLFGVISLDKIVLCYGVLSLMFGGFSSKVEDF